MKRRDLIIVPCSSRKNILLNFRSLPARSAYTGQAFVFARDYIEAFEIDWIILSAKHGFIWPTTRIAYYDARMPSGQVPHDVRESIYRMTRSDFTRLMEFGRYVCLGGADYCNAAEQILRKPIERPLAGLGIGKMLFNLKWAEWDAANHTKR